MAAGANLSSFFASALPGVQIDKIVLNVANEKWQSPFSKDPHVEYIAGPGYPPWLRAALWKAETTTSKESLDVFVNFSLKAKVPKGKDLISSWIFNKDFLSFYKIKIISVENEEYYASIHADNEKIKTLLEAKKAGGGTPGPAVEAGETISLSSTGLFNLSDADEIKEHVQDFHKTIDNDGNIIYDIPFSHRITVKEVNPKHLSLFIIPYLDVNKMKSDFGIAGDVEPIIGPPIDEPIIRNGKAVTTKTVYRQIPTPQEIATFVPSPTNLIVQGKQWFGPVHYHSGRRIPRSDNPKKFKIDNSGYIGWMGGEKHYPNASPPQPRLTTETAYNRTIQDFRTLKRIERVLFDFSETLAPEDEHGNPKQRTGLNAVTFPINDNLDIERKPSYFSELFTSRDQFGKCRFFFSVDYLSMIRKNSAFPVLFRNSPVGLPSELLRRSYIRSFKLFRRRAAPTASGFNKLGTKTSVEFEQNEASVLLVHTKDDALGAGPVFGGRAARLHPRKLSVIDYPGFDGEHKDKDATRRNLGAIKEVNLMTQDVKSDYPFMRHFTGVDHEISGLTSGRYRYDVEIEIEDPTVNYIESRLTELVDISTAIEKYYTIATSQNISSPEAISPPIGKNVAGRRRYRLNYSVIAQSFRPEFLEDMLLVFSPGSLRENTWLYNVAFLAKASPKQNQVLKTMVKKYLDILGMVTSTWDHYADDLINDLVKIIDPIVGSPEGIGIFFKLVSDLATNIERMLNAAISGPVIKDQPDPKFAGTAPQSLKIDATRTFKVRKEFSNLEDLFDSDVNKHFGVDYLTSDPPISDFELSLLSTGDYRERANLEMRKYFGGGHKNSFTLDPTFQSGIHLPLSPQKYTYFSPMAVRTRKNRQHELLIEALLGSNKFYEPDIYNQLLIDVLRHNDGLNVELDPYPVGKNYPYRVKATQRLRGGLLDFMANRSCTVSSMESFKAEIENNENEDICGHQNIFWDVNQYDNIIDVLPLVIINPAGQGSSEPFQAKSYINDLTNPNKVLTQLASRFYAPSYKFRPYRDYDIHNPDQIIFDTAENASKAMYDYPNQYKSMIGVCTQRMKPATWVHHQIVEHDLIFDLKREIFNPDKRHKALGFFYLNFMDLCYVEVLTGYLRPANDVGAQMNKPIFKKIEEKNWDIINSYKGDRDNRILCRIKRYNDSKLNVPEIESFNFPIYNQHFLLKTGPSQKELAKLLSLGPTPQTPAEFALTEAALNAFGKSAVETKSASVTTDIASVAASALEGFAPIVAPGGAAPLPGSLLSRLADEAPVSGEIRQSGAGPVSVVNYEAVPFVPNTKNPLDPDATATAKSRGKNLVAISARAAANKFAQTAKTTKKRD